jgi:hypothetical protein
MICFCNATARLEAARRIHGLRVLPGALHGLWRGSVRGGPSEAILPGGVSVLHAHARKGVLFAPRLQPGMPATRDRFSIARCQFVLRCIFSRTRVHPRSLVPDKRHHRDHPGTLASRKAICIAAGFLSARAPSTDEMDNLIRVGAFDSFGESRTAQFWEFRELAQWPHVAGQGMLLGGEKPALPLVPLSEPDIPRLSGSLALPICTTLRPNARANGEVLRS